MPLASSTERPTRMRFLILGIAVCVAILLYLDRYCLSTADRNIKDDLGLSEKEMANLLGAFFFPYAFGQIPFGYLADRFGARRMLSLYMFVWSGFTGLLGIARGYTDFLLYRLGCGLFEAGGYPACAGIIKRWIPLPRRGLASGIVSIGGRLGGTITPTLTATLMAWFAIRLPEYFSWRPTLIVFGLCGMALAVAFWVVHRDRPENHPWCNAAELDEITAGQSPPVVAPSAFTSSPSTAAAIASAPDASPTIAPPSAFPWLGVLKHRSLWISSFVQFGSNFGQVFLATYLNRYLLEVHEIADLETRGRMSSLVFFLSLPALIIGGVMTDALTKRFGQRWGRAMPMALPRFFAAGLFVVVPFITWAWPEVTPARAWMVIVVLGLVAFFSDLTLAAIWAFNMDIGGRIVGLILGWGNMWGNIGAGASPNAIRVIEASFGWDAVFYTCGGAFLVIAVAALFIDSTEKIEGT